MRAPYTRLKNHYIHPMLPMLETPGIDVKLLQLQVRRTSLWEGSLERSKKSQDLIQF